MVCAACGGGEFVASALFVFIADVNAQGRHAVGIYWWP